MFLISLAIYAQPVISSSDITGDFSANCFSIQDSTLIPGMSGENATWDFSSLNAPLVSTLRLVEPSETPYYNFFPQSNYCYELVHSNGVLYQYNILTETSLNFLGQASPTTNQVFVYNVDPVKIFDLPYIYGSTFTDVFATTNTTGTFTSTYDSYGTIILPFGTFTNVVRQISNYARLQYTWYHTNPYYQLARLDIDYGAFGQRRFTMWENTTQLSLPQIENQSSFILYPNPNNGNFIITSEKQLLQIIITDIMGKEIDNISPNSLSTEITLKNCKTGTYLIKCITENNVLFKKIIVK